MMEVIENHQKLKRRVEDVLELVNLKTSGWTISQMNISGKQQRVAIVVHCEYTWILIADEPTGNLDPETLWKLWISLNGQRTRNTS